MSRPTDLVQGTLDLLLLKILALEPLNFEVLCPGCHNAIEPRTGGSGVSTACDEHGMPTDPSHPWFNFK